MQETPKEHLPERNISEFDRGDAQSGQRQSLFKLCRDGHIPCEVTPLSLQGRRVSWRLCRWQGQLRCRHKRWLLQKGSDWRHIQVRVTRSYSSSCILPRPCCCNGQVVCQRLTDMWLCSKYVTMVTKTITAFENDVVTKVSTQTTASHHQLIETSRGNKTLDSSRQKSRHQTV